MKHSVKVLDSSRVISRHIYFTHKEVLNGRAKIFPWIFSAIIVGLVILFDSLSTVSDRISFANLIVEVIGTAAVVVAILQFYSISEPSLATDSL